MTDAQLARDSIAQIQRMPEALLVHPPRGITVYNTQLTVNAIDPTHTVVLRDEFRAFYARVWHRIAQEAERIAQEADRLRTPSERIAYFNAQVRLLVEREMGRAERDFAFGVEALLMAAYLRGMRQADADARGIGVRVPDTPVEAVRDDDHREELAALLLLWLADLRGTNEAALARLQASYGARAYRIPARRTVTEEARFTGRTSLAGFVSTAVVSAFNTAILARFVDLGIMFVAGVAELQLVTAGDAKVCERCQELARQNNGFGPGIYTIQQARGLLPVHRRCRCRWRAVRRENNATSAR